MFLLAISAYAVVEVVKRSNEHGAESNWWRQSEITIVMSLISYIFPMFFEVLGLLEDNHPRRQLRIQLAR
jgi:transmembrane channel-like protein